VTDPNQADADTDASAPDAAHLTPDTEFEDRERAVGIDPDAPLPGERGLRIILFGAIALFGIPAVLGAGIAAGYPIIGIVLAVALGAVCLLFARPRNG
jgi:hypothetical protein